MISCLFKLIFSFFKNKKKCSCCQEWVRKECGIGFCENLEKSEKFLTKDCDTCEYFKEVEHDKKF